jgi:hypothetical protein
MANRDLLADAIADAKAVKEVAIANAKAALEEAFTPHLKDMLAQKINEMEELEETEELAEVDKEKKMEEEKEVKEGKKEDMDEAKDKMDEAENMDEELDLEEILAELELDEGDDIDEAKDMDEAKEVDEAKDKVDEAEDMDEGDDMYEGDDVYEAEEEEVEVDAEEEINLEDMSEEDLKGFIEEIIEDMIEDGELVPGPNADESEAEEDEGAEAEGEVGDADVDVDVDLQEGKEKVNESALLAALGGIVGTSSAALLVQYLENYAEQNPDSPIGKIMKKVQAVAAGTGAATGMTAGKTAELEEGILDFLKKKKKSAPAPTKPTEKVLGVDFDGNYIYGEGKEELEEAKEVIKTLRSDLNEVNLLNSKLLYTNKIFRGKNLTENQKIKVLKAFDKAETVKEAKAIFETLNENLVAKTNKSNIRESLGAASKPAGVSPKRSLNESIVEEDAMVSRFKKLAGIN